MASPVFDDIQVCVFDAYGTLFDVHSAVGRHRARLGEKADAVSALWRTKQLEYTWLRSLMHVYADFEQVTGEALEYAFAVNRIVDTGLHDDLMSAYLQLDCYPEVPETLAGLRAAGMRTAILSNGSPSMLASAVASAGLADLLDEVISVHSLAVYKPHPDVYRMAPRRFGVEPRQVSFQSSNAWDVAGAASFGFRVAWVNRFGQVPERLPSGADAEIPSLAGLPALVIG